MGEVKHTLFTRDTVDYDSFERFEKIRTTPARRIEGTFHCVTSEGNVASCTDGWLAIDSRGYPYPVNDLEFGLTYRATGLAD
jgi:hypothetical protein